MFHFRHLLDVGHAVDVLTMVRKLVRKPPSQRWLMKNWLDSMQTLDDGLSLTLRSDEKNALALEVKSARNLVPLKSGTVF